MRLLAAFLLLLPLQSHAETVVDRVLDEVILPGMANFADRTAALAAAAQVDCSPQNPNLLGAWNAAMDSWFRIQDFRFGPLEDGAQRQAIAYWPDTTGHRQRALSRILSGQDPILQTPARYEEEAVSVRGLYAIESMLYDPDFNTYAIGDPGCVLVQAASADLAKVGANLEEAWRTDFVTVMRTAGESGNARFLDASEAVQVVFTALLTAIQFDIDERLGLPLGTYDKPRPLRAEGRISRRSQRNLELSLAGHARLVVALVPDEDKIPDTRAEFLRINRAISELDDPDFSGVSNPEGRFRVEALQTLVTVLRATVNRELSAALGVTMGLNALDGD